MQLVLERRPERSAVIAVASPLIAVVLTIITSGVALTTISCKVNGSVSGWMK